MSHVTIIIAVRFALLFSCAVVGLAAQLPVITHRTGPLNSQTLELRGLDPEQSYSLLFSVHSPRAFDADSELTIRLSQGASSIVSKTLHLGDPDFYTMFHVPRHGAAQLRIEPTGKLAGSYTLQVNRWPVSVSLKREPNDRWEDATPIRLGETVFASSDETEYIPLAGTPKLDKFGAEDWYRLDFDGASPKLVYFQIELAERDNLPVDVAIYRVVDGKPAGYYEGEDPVTMPHESQALPGNKFTTRILKDKGAYYVCVRANHPEYKLRTRVYDPPPYADPRKAVRTGLDYILGAGDSWHANTPRRGGIFDRVDNVHQETSLCVACHATHFPQRAQLYAAANGYPVVQRQQLQFLAERFYNNPRPFYGFEKDGAVWARVISAPANVLSRMSTLMDLFERHVSGERREEFHRGIAEYLKLYYAGRNTLPPDETNGNTPLVPAFEVAWYSWRVTHDARRPEMIAQGEVKNVNDLCYQTLALADIDRTKYKEQIARNAERLLSVQRPDGQWAMRFEAAQPEVEFQTGHALWALEAAGVAKSNPQVAKAIAYLLQRQQPFGGWMDPLQSYENFRTPFRETQMAILALSAYFPEDGRVKGWNAPAPAKLSDDHVELLRQLDGIWDPAPPELLREIAAASSSNDALVRQAAVEALGRLAVPGTSATLSERLGDPSKLVQRTAAWALRQIYSRHPDEPSDVLTRALASADDRTRWGATRVFAQHFAALARRPEIAPALAGRIDDPVTTVRMQAIKGLWQFWFWSADDAARNRIEDTILQAMAKPQHPWIAANLRAAVYNLADENIRYLYNNWVPLLGREQDREQAIRGRLAVEARLSDKFARVLEEGSDLQRKELLAGLVDFPLRHGDVYLPEVESQPFWKSEAQPVYNRIGNDTEQIVFFGSSAERFAHALRPLADSADPELRRLAIDAALLVRPVRFAEVNRIAGATSADAKAVLALLPKEAPRMAEAAYTRTSPRRKLDETFFRAYVEPILTRRGKDSNACVNCHATHTLFNGTYSTVNNVVDSEHPENSLILRKPTSSAETEGTLNSKQLAHGGGVRWEKGSPEYQTILEWIKGAKQ
jgi:hypothetical protein